MQPRTVALIALLALTVGWLANSVVEPQPPTAAPASAARGPRPLGTTDPPAPYTEQLRLKLKTQPRSPSPQRNLFAFGSRRSSAPRRVEPAEPVEMAPLPPPMPIGPTFILTGVAESIADGKSTYTAIIRGNSGLLFVTAGDALPGGYKVVRVEETSAVIADAAGTELLLRLK